MPEVVGGSIYKADSYYVGSSAEGEKYFLVDCYHVFNKVIIKKVCIKFVSGVKTIFAVLKFNNPLGSDSFCELKRLSVLLLFSI